MLDDIRNERGARGDKAIGGPIVLDLQDLKPGHKKRPPSLVGGRSLYWFPAPGWCFRKKGISSLGFREYYSIVRALGSNRHWYFGRTIVTFFVDPRAIAIFTDFNGKSPGSSHRPGAEGNSEHPSHLQTEE